MKPSFYLLLLLLVTSASFSATPVSVRVELDDGQFFSGTPVSFRDELLFIRMEIDGGEFERGFPQSSISNLHFSDTTIIAEAAELIDDGLPVEALPLLEEIWLPRASLLPLLDSEMISFLAELPPAHLAAGNLYRAIGLAERLLPHAKDPIVADRILEVIFVGHMRLDLTAEADLRAREWIQDQPRFPSSALGWRILADLALQEERLEDAQWIALQPIALADPGTIRHLEHCYALAIHAYWMLEQTERAAALFNEMRQRNLPWPDDSRFRKTKTALANHVEIGGEAEETEIDEADLDLRPAEKELNLPIDEVRKTLISTSPESP